MVQSFSSDLFAMTNDAEVDMGNIENALNSLKSSFSGPTAPSAEQGQLWYDTTRSLLRHRGAASNWRGVIAGSSAFKIWVYANAVEEGFTEDTDCADCVLGLKGGAQAYNTTGGDGTPKGAWVITGITDTGHSHSHSHSHYHKWYDYIGFNSQDKDGAGTLINPSGRGLSAKYIGVFSGENQQSSNVDLNTDTDATVDATSSTANISVSGTWRPQAAVGIMVFPAVI